MMGVASFLLLIGIGGVVCGIVLFTKKRYAWGAVVTTASLLAIAAALFLGGITLLSQLAWH